MNWLEESMKLIADQVNLRKGPAIIRKSDLKWETTSMASRSALVMHPKINNSVAQSMMAFFTEIPPGGKTGRHRHNSEAIIHILQGRGYSIFDDVRYDWEAGDTISPPANSWHQLFNADAEKPVVIFAVTNNPLLEAIGIHVQEQAGARHDG
jgi:gentisate 1,2-dioxygenase